VSEDAAEELKLGGRGRMLWLTLGKKPHGEVTRKSMGGKMGGELTEQSQSGSAKSRAGSK